MQNLNQKTTTLSNETFVRVTDYIPDIAVELQYSSEQNFTGKKIYPFTDAWLRYGTVKKLLTAQNTLKPLGYRLKIWDAFRPVAAQFVLWETYPDDTFVANPNLGFSWHSRGNTVDLTMIDNNGAEVLMPTPFDNFFYQYENDLSEKEKETAASHALLLKNTMISAGFRPYEPEWWHFYDLDKYEVEMDLQLNI